jgi:hypothetical protein
MCLLCIGTSPPGGTHDTLATFQGLFSGVWPRQMTTSCRISDSHCSLLAKK